MSSVCYKPSELDSTELQVWLENVRNLGKEYRLKRNRYNRNIVQEAATQNRKDVIADVFKMCSHQEVLELLSTLDDSQRSPLMLAATSDAPEVLEELLKSTKLKDSLTLLKQQDRFGCTVAHLCTSMSTMRHLIKFCSQHPDDWFELLKQVDEDDKTAVHYAAENKSAEMISAMLESLSADQCYSLLLLKGTDESFIPSSWTALQVAVSQGSDNCLQRMLRKFEDQNRRYNLLASRDSAGENVLHLAMENNHSNCIKVILKEISSEKLSEFLALTSDSETTVLHNAARVGFKNGIEMIMDALPMEDASKVLSKQNALGLTALDVAIKYHPGDAELTRILTKNRITCSNGKLRYSVLTSHVLRATTVD